MSLNGPGKPRWTLGRAVPVGLGLIALAMSSPWGRAGAQSPRAAGPTETDLVSVVTTAHKAAVQRWSTLYCVVERRDGSGSDTRVTRCTFWMNGDRIRCHETSNNDPRVYDGLSSGGV